MVQAVVMKLENLCYYLHIGCLELSPEGQVHFSRRTWQVIQKGIDTAITIRLQKTTTS